MAETINIAIVENGNYGKYAQTFQVFTAFPLTSARYGVALSVACNLKASTLGNAKTASISSAESSLQRTRSLTCVFIQRECM